MTIIKPNSIPKWRFKNSKIRKSLPEDIISVEKKSDDEEIFQNTILTLTLIYNDAKNIVLINETLANVYELDLEKAICDNNGELTGVNQYISRILFSHIHEALMYIKKQRKILESECFKKLTNNMSTDSKLKWELISTIAYEEELDERKFKKGFGGEYSNIIELLKTIRDNVGFHYQYDNHPKKKRIVDGYRKFFFKEPKEKKNEYALRSYQKTEFSNTRYYFTDATIEGYFSDLLNDKHNIADFTNMALEISALISFSINSILGEFFKTLPNR